jgi:hypothetical protein
LGPRNGIMDASGEERKQTMVWDMPRKQLWRIGKSRRNNRRGQDIMVGIGRRGHGETHVEQVIREKSRLLREPVSDGFEHREQSSSR